MSTDESDDYCGYRQGKFLIERFGLDWDGEVFVDTEQWGEEITMVVCLRDPWTDHDRCVWHAETKDKSADDFKTLRANGPERLDGAYLANVELNDRFSFAGCWLRGANLSGANLTKADLADAHLSEADLSDANLHHADLSEVRLHHADLSGAELRYANLSDANLFDADLLEAHLRHADLSEASLYHADLSEANLHHADLSGADLRTANLSGADLSYADLSKVNLRGADLPNATLTDADLTNANIRDATLLYATLEDTVLTTTDCRGTDFRSARLYQVILRDTRINSTTQFVNQEGDVFGKCIYELSPNEILADDEDEFDYECHPYEAAAWTYRRLQSLHEKMHSQNTPAISTSARKKSNGRITAG